MAVALEHHRLVGRDLQGRFVLGPRLIELAESAGEDPLLATAGPILTRLRDITGESVQLFRRQGDLRICVASVERPTGLRDSVPVGAQLPMTAGSAAQVLLAWGLRRGYVVLPKSSTPSRIEANFQIPELSDEDFKAIEDVASTRHFRFVNMKDTFGYNVWPEEMQ